MSTTDANGIDFSALFSPKEVLCRTQASERDEVFRSLLETLAYNRGIGNVDEACEALRAREAETATIVGPGIAVPHARLEAIDEIAVAVATSAQGIDYGGQAVQLVILILAPKALPGAYLQALSALAKVCQDPETASILADMESPEEVWNFFAKGGLVLPEHLFAKHLMDPVHAALQENDTLENALDLFVRENVAELPVVDRDGELIGVVTTHEFLRVCLPDYILWMEDLTPILNFEPFAEILRKESNTWLAEIMTAEYATVREDAPAVQVAKEITRRNTEHAYVVRGKKLVGVVALNAFLNKILRE